MNTPNQGPLDLTPCPFCGSQATIGRDGKAWRVCCILGGCEQGVLGFTEAEAAEKWNRRAGPCRCASRLDDWREKLWPKISQNGEHQRPDPNPKSSPPNLTGQEPREWTIIGGKAGENDRVDNGPELEKYESVRVREVLPGPVTGDREALPLVRRMVTWWDDTRPPVGEGHIIVDDMRALLSKVGEFGEGNKGEAG